MIVRIPQGAPAWWMCVVRVAWGAGGSGPVPPLPFSSLSPGPTLHRPPSSRLCSPTIPRGKAQGTAGGVALSTCGLRMRRYGTQRSTTGNAAVQVSRQERELQDSRKFLPET